MSTPWDAPAIVDRYDHGLTPQPGIFAGTLREAVIFTLSQPNERGDGYVIRLDDGSVKWEGGEIADLGRDLS